jgi:hypothetical protein
MKTTIPLRGLPRGVAIVAALVVATGALAQNRGGTFYGPFTDVDVQFLSAVWPEIRKAAAYEHIHWPAYGLARTPASGEGQRLLAANWGELRGAARFEHIDWDNLIEDRGPSQASRYQRSSESFERRFPGPFTRYGLFTREDAAALSQVWREIREAAEFNHIDWRAVGLLRPPGSREARRVMTTNWSLLREAARFEDIDWAATTGQSRRVR